MEAVFDVCKLLILERETGLEPVTSSLGISASIAYKGHGVHSGDKDPWNFSNLRPLPSEHLLNGVEMEGTSLFRQPKRE
jgi:hypothetical protein